MLHCIIVLNISSKSYPNMYVNINIMYGVHIYYIYIYIYIFYLFIFVIFHMLHDNLKNQMTSVLRKHWVACDIFQLFLGLSQNGMLLILCKLSDAVPKTTTIPLKHSSSPSDH